MKSKQGKQMREIEFCKITADLGNSVTPRSITTFSLKRSQKREKKWPENLLQKIVVENFLNLEKKTHIQSPKAHRSPQNSTQGGPHQEKIVIKMEKK